MLRIKTGWMTALVVLLAGSSLLVSQRSWASESDESFTMATRGGKMAGLKIEDVLHFRGVRFAEPPTGERRFLPPVAAGSWAGTYDATSFPNRCVQPPGGLGSATGDTDEDCLFLNVATPGAEGKRPVLFWIHGGAFTQGSANDYDGSVLAAQGDVVVVTINYRLGLFGFAELSSLGDAFVGSGGNGLRDQILALEWVRDNISDFGGDPANVTIFGESAGGASVHSLLASPAADGLYHKAVAHSPGTANLPSQDQVSAIAGRLGGVSGADLISKLRTISAAEVIQIQTAVGTNGGRIDGTVVTRSTNEAILARGSSGVPLIAGTNLDEGTLFTMLLPQPMWHLIGRGLATSVTSGADPTPYLDALEAAYPKDTKKQNHERIWVDMFRHSAIGSTQRASEAGPGGWLYRFDMPSTVPMGGQNMGATHAAEIAFTFNTFAGGESPLDLYDADDPAVKDLAKRWSSTIIAFAKTGNPNGAGLPHWPRYSSSDRQTLILDAKPRVERNVDQDQRALWKSVGAVP